VTVVAFLSADVDQFLRCTLRVTAECFARLSHCLGVCPSVSHTLDLYQNSAS